jgi:hypothetical protein
MFRWTTKSTTWTACWLIWTTWAAGCAGKSGDAERFIPKSGTARAALEAALNEWRDGQPPGAVAGATPAVQVVDTHRRPEQRLEQFEILGEVGGDAGRCFAVRITLSNPTEELKVRFVVIGISPLWVFREEDFTMLIHWDHAMPGAAE